MTDQEFMQQTEDRLDRLRGQQRLLHEQLARDIGQMFGLRMTLSTVAGGAGSSRQFPLVPISVDSRWTAISGRHAFAAPLISITH